MFNNLVVAYLFLGGMGAGACGVLGVLSMVVFRSGSPVFGSRFSPNITLQRFFGLGFLVASVACAVGAFCLLADLKRPDEIIFLLTSPVLSVVSVGAYALAATILCGAFLGMAWLRAFRVAPVVVLAFTAVLVALSCMTMAYTALLLMSFSGIRLFQSPWLIALFAMSSLSCGVAAVSLCASITRTRKSLFYLMDRLSFVHEAVILGEMLTLASFLLSSSAVAPGSVWMLINGDLAVYFWVGVVACGLALPFVLRAARHKALLSRVHPALSAVLVMVGGFMLRWCILAAA